MDPVDGGDNCWEFLDYNYINRLDSPDFLFFNDNPSCYSTNIDFPSAGEVSTDNVTNDGDYLAFSCESVACKEESENPRSWKRSSCDDVLSSLPLSQEDDTLRKRICRAQDDICDRRGAKACREKMRREKLNDRFFDLSSVLDPGRPVKTDKPALLDDAIRLLNSLRNETQELKAANEKLQEEIKFLKEEKNELREEKLILKADKERMELQLKSMTVSSGFMQTHPAAYHPGQNKVAVYPGYSLIPMWQCLPPTACDTSRDHELRPPAA